MGTQAGRQAGRRAGLLGKAFSLLHWVCLGSLINPWRRYPLYSGQGLDLPHLSSPLQQPCRWQLFYILDIKVLWIKLPKAIPQAARAGIQTDAEALSSSALPPHQISPQIQLYLEGFLSSLLSFFLMPTHKPCSLMENCRDVKRSGSSTKQFCSERRLRMNAEDGDFVSSVHCRMPHVQGSAWYVPTPRRHLISVC